MAMKVSDSQWHKELSELGRQIGEDKSPYWLRPFENFKTFCPYLVRSYARVAAMLGRYLEEKAKGRASEALRHLVNLQPRTARVLKDGVEAEVQQSELQTGDLIFFASIRKNLDIFHCGIIVRDGKRILMRHASRSSGGVVEQNFDEFLKANRMAGVIVVRPVEEER